ncbi:hypothetical protein ACFFRR_001149 [Megaselia abdita]
MSGYENRNNLRRLGGHDEQQFSKDSIVNVMEKFVKSVNTMDETILVPCRLMDKQVGDATDAIQMNPSTSQQLTQQGIKKKKTVHEALNSADLFNLYNMLNALKIDFLWTDNLADDEEVKTYPNSQDSTNTTSAPLSSLSNTKGHQRTPSLVSMTSTNSVSNLSDSDSEISNENDSGIESENGGIKQRLNTDKATELAKQCRRHLSGLYGCLEQMTDAANYLTDRYQNEIGSV